VVRESTEAHGRTASSIAGNGGRRQQTCLRNKASKPIEGKIDVVGFRTRSRVRKHIGDLSEKRQGGSGDRVHEALRGGVVREQALWTGRNFEG
jgi:predicted transcriptional regulator